MQTKIKLMTIAASVLLALALQVSELSAFGSPVEQPAPTRPIPPPCAPDCATEPELHVVLEPSQPAHHERKSHEASEPLARVEFGWSVLAWDPLEVWYQAGPEE